MANEITVNLSISIFKPAIMTTAIGRSISGLLASMAGNQFIEGSLIIGITATQIPLGNATPHWCFFRNMDLTNFINLRNGAGGADLVQLLPGEAACFPVLSTSSPYGIANVSPCLLEYLVVSL